MSPFWMREKKIAILKGFASELHSQFMALNSKNTSELLYRFFDQRLWKMWLFSIYFLDLRKNGKSSTDNCRNITFSFFFFTEESKIKAVVVLSRKYFERYTEKWFFSHHKKVTRKVRSSSICHFRKYCYVVKKGKYHFIM